MCCTVLRQFVHFLVKPLSLVISVIAHFGFDDRGLVLVVPLHGHCLYSIFFSKQYQYSVQISICQIINCVTL